MQINISLSSNIVMGLLLAAVGLIQIYKGATRKVPAFTQSESDSGSLDLSALSSSAQEAKLTGSGPAMETKMDNLAIVSGLMLVVVGVMKAFFNKNSA